MVFRHLCSTTSRAICVGLKKSYFSKLKSQEFQKGREVVISYELNVYSTVKKSKVKGVLLLNEMVFGVVCFFLFLRRRSTFYHLSKQ